MAEKVRTGMNVYAGMTREQRKSEVNKRKQIIIQMLDEGKDMKQIADEIGYHYRTVVRIRQEYFGEKGIFVVSSKRIRRFQPSTSVGLPE